MYVIFLIILSLALGLGATINEPTSYQGKVDRFRGFCEVMSILFSVFYMCIELEQFIRYEQVTSFLRIWSHLLKKSLMENFIFYAV